MNGALLRSRAYSHHVARRRGPTAAAAEDFWLFDSRLIALLRFDDDDQLTHVDLITEPAEVVRCCMVRDAAWHYAVPWQQFTAEMRNGA
jgi:hypothetical protein